MGKIYLKLTAVALLTTLFGGISKSNAQALKPCGLPEYLQVLYNANPGLKEKIEAYENAQNHSVKRVNGPDTTLYIIPIVFHIIHSYTAEDISDEQVINQVNILNRDYRAVNADTANVVSAFKKVIGDAHIQFRLAQLDPNGKATNGIDRVYSPKTQGGGDQSKLNDWDPTRYLNVWTTATIGTAGVAGYSNYPSTYNWQPQNTDGVIILSNYIGGTGSGPKGAFSGSDATSRALTHEIGHYLNLAHVWGSNNQPGNACGDDGVTDTPVSIGWTTCNLSANDVCTKGVQENVQNYMEYSYCSTMYTAGQVTRMRAALTSSTASRNNLWTSTNLTNTGVLNNPPLTPVPVADFNPSPLFTCLGGTVNLKDLSWKGTPTGWKWELPGSEMGVYTTQNPTVKYNAAGIYDVKLVAQNSAGTDSVTKTGLIYVTDPSKATAIPYKQSFEDPGTDITTTPGWSMINQFNDNVKWVKTNITSYSGSQSLMLGNISTKDSLLKDAFITPNFDFSKATDPKLSFKYAYACKKATYADNFRVYYSTNCGVSWYYAAIMPASKLNTNGSITSKNFYPLTPANWKDMVVSIPSIAGNANVIFKFEYTYSLAGNNLFLDDISLYPNNTALVAGTTELTKETANWVTVSPNPAVADRDLKVSFNLDQNKDVMISLYDLTGREVIKEARKNQSEGDNEIIINIAHLKSGIYLMNFHTDKTSKQFKIVVE